MTISITTRLNVYRWTADEDQFLRSHMDASHDSIEQLAAKYTSGTTLPAADAAWARSFFYKSDTQVIYYFNGTDNTGSWVPVNNFGGTISSITYGGSASDGVSTFAARGDHVHASPAIFGGSVVGLSYGGSNGDGVSVTASRSDHTHAVPALFGGTVSALTYGGSVSSGTASFAARVDHVHALPFIDGGTA